MKNILVVIPARGGSKGIPRKNLRRLNGKPLLHYSIGVAKASKFHPDVFVSSEDDEIINSALLLGAEIHRRSMEIAGDAITLDPVIYACYEYAREKKGKQYDLIITLQPTSPLLKPESLDNAISLALQQDEPCTVISVKNNTHLSWRKEGERFVPNYTERLNRQYLTQTYVETGSFFITPSSIITESERIGENVQLYELSDGEEIDIDTFDDWNLCEYILKRKHVLFVVTGNNKVGLGHVYNCLLLANDILNHKLSFIVDKNSQLAMDKIASFNYEVSIQKSDDLIEDIRSINPDVVINDILDTSYNYVEGLKATGVKVINFEDLGEGAGLADLVVNAIYPEKRLKPNHFFGHAYFLLRDEFIYSPVKEISDRVSQVLVSFGGVDPNNFTLKVIDAIYDFCIEQDINIKVIAGYGYTKYASLDKFERIEILTDVKNIADHMSKADLIFTSAGRTTFEVASMGTPAIVLAQNERELTHFFASGEFGFVNKGLGIDVNKEEILADFRELVESEESRKYSSELMLSTDLKSGRRRVNELIQKILKSYESN